MSSNDGLSLEPSDLLQGGNGLSDEEDDLLRRTATPWAIDSSSHVDKTPTTYQMKRQRDIERLNIKNMLHAIGIVNHQVPLNGFRAQGFDKKNRTRGRYVKNLQEVMEGVFRLLCPENPQLLQSVYLETLKVNKSKDTEMAELLSKAATNMSIAALSDDKMISNVGLCLLSSTFQRDRCNEILKKSAKELTGVDEATANSISITNGMVTSKGSSMLELVRSGQLMVADEHGGDIETSLAHLQSYGVEHDHDLLSVADLGPAPFAPSVHDSMAVRRQRYQRLLERKILNRHKFTTRRDNFKLIKEGKPYPSKRKKEAVV